MAGAVGNYSDGETIHGGDLNADLTSLLGNDAQLFLDIFAGWNILVSGFALTAGAGMAVNIAAGLAYASGIRLNMLSGSVTLGAGNAQPRYDVIWVQAGKTAATNGTTSNPTQYDSGVYGVQAGTPGASPAVPALGDPTKVQIGTVLVPASATLASGCTLNSYATAPNAQGPVKTFVDLLTHIAATITASNAVHGIQQGSGHGFDADTVDGVHAAGFDAAGTAATQVASEAGTRAAADTTEATARAGVQTNLTNHAAQSLYTGITHGEESRRGHATGISITSGSGFGVVATVTFSPAMAGTPQCVTLTMDTANPGGAPPVPQGVSATGFSIAMSTAGTYNGGVYWRADS
jgi:hypothetical protein